MSDNTVTIIGTATRVLEIAPRITEFWRSVDVCGDDECWLWTGYVEKGYGRFYFEGRMAGAHELALSFTTGEAKHPALDTCHSCDTPLCCNPAHLRFDTRQSNVDDCTSQGRHAHGERNGHAKLAEAQVVLMRERATHGASGKTLAAEFGVSPALVTAILRGERWARAGGPLRTQHGNTKHGRYAQ